jgi:general stress protein 26
MSEKFLYMSSTGRVTGKAHRIEIWFAEHEGCFYLCSEYPDKSDWVKNIRKSPQVQFHVGEAEQEIADMAGTAEVVTDEAELEPVKAQFREKYNWDNGLFVRICPE